MTDEFRYYFDTLSEPVKSIDSCRNECSCRNKAVSQVFFQSIKLAIEIAYTLC
jgi:hypothetical protein